MIERENQIVMLGSDYPLFGRVSHRSLSGGTSCAISAGVSGKRGKLAPNEDALLAFDDGHVAILAVADGHFGLEASHDLICALAERITSEHRTLKELQALIATLSEQAKPAGRRSSETTLVLAAVDRLTGRGAAISYGDSSLALQSSAGTEVFPRERAVRFVSLSIPGTLAPHNAHAFEFRVRPGDLVLAYSDGLDTCRPGDATDLGATAAMLQAIRNPADTSPGTFARAVTAAALRGWRGHAGATDNVALVVTRV